MNSAETTQLKLKTTPTGGVEASHSPYYRRLLSAGYKGYLQGTIGGASLYGTIGLVIGSLVALPLLFSPVGWAALALIPAAGGVGVYKGASTFGDIGSTAAINAESADLAEQRRYLLDRYNDLPNGPEGDREAAEIRKQLGEMQGDVIQHPPFFHWKTVAICAVVGAALALTLCSPVGAFIFGPTALGHVFGALGIHTLTGAGIAAAGTAPAGLGVLAAGSGALTAIGVAAGTALGALAGAVIGIDRYYVRKWFDATEGVVHGASHTGSVLDERGASVERLRQAAQEDSIVKENLTHQHTAMPAREAASAPAPQLNTTDATAKPDTKITQAAAQDRLEKLQQVMNVTL